MQIGIGLPATIPGVRGTNILDWARRADAGPFSTLGVLDRIVFPNYEPMIALAGAAGVTQRIRLMTTVLLAPVRDAALLAKQSASLDALSGGRLTLGLGIGAREDDFKATGATFRDRGRRFEQQLALMKRIWAGEPVAEDVGPVGPSPARGSGPELLIGGYTPKAVRRVARYADGYIAGGSTAGNARQLYGMVEEAWKAEGRSGKPRFVTALYWALGPRAEEGVRGYIGTYYGAMAERIIPGVPTTPEALKTAIQSFADAGADELIMWPCLPDVE